MKSINMQDSGYFINAQYNNLIRTYELGPVWQVITQLELEQVPERFFSDYWDKCAEDQQLLILLTALQANVEVKKKWVGVLIKRLKTQGVFETQGNNLVFNTETLLQAFLNHIEKPFIKTTYSLSSAIESKEPGFLKNLSIPQNELVEMAKSLQKEHSSIYFSVDRYEKVFSILNKDQSSALWKEIDLPAKALVLKHFYKSNIRSIYSSKEEFMNGQFEANVLKVKLENFSFLGQHSLKAAKLMSEMSEYLECVQKRAIVASEQGFKFEQPGVLRNITDLEAKEGLLTKIKKMHVKCQKMKQAGVDTKELEFFGAVAAMDFIMAVKFEWESVQKANIHTNLKTKKLLKSYSHLWAKCRVISQNLPIDFVLSQNWSKSNFKQNEYLYKPGVANSYSCVYDMLLFAFSERVSKKSKSIKKFKI